jgi:predicted phosphodiesterase
MRTLALSDMHLGRVSSSIQTPESLAPLVEGFDRILLLGDVVDEWYLSHQQAQELEHRVRHVCRSSGAKEILWCRGNHDANRKEGEEYALIDGVLYLHGHAIYNELNGSGPLRDQIRAMNAERFGPERSGSRKDKHTWRIVEHAYRRFPHVLLVPLLWRSSIKRKMLAVAREVAKEGAVHAMVLGHSHAPGVRHLRSLHVFNLGGWMQNTRACGFIFENGWARLVHVEKKHGQPQWGRVWHEARIVDSSHAT